MMQGALGCSVRRRHQQAPHSPLPHATQPLTLLSPPIFRHSQDHAGSRSGRRIYLASPSLFFLSIVCPAPPLDAAASTLRVLVTFRSEEREPSFFVSLKHPTSRALELVGATTTRHVAAMFERAAPRAASNDSPRY